MVKIMRRLSIGGGTKEPARSRAVDDLLDTDLDLELADSSMRSFASSITSPPSQSGSFYHRVQKQNEASELERKYGYNQSEMSGNIPEDWVSDSTDDEDAQSTSSWGGFPSKSSTADETIDASDRSSGSGRKGNMKKSQSSRVETSTSSNSNSNSNSNKKKKKKKKRLKDFFRKSSQDNEPITEVDEADLITESEGREGSMSLPPLSDNNLNAGLGGQQDGGSDIESQSEQNSAAHSQYSRTSSKSGKSKGSRKGRRLSPSRGGGGNNNNNNNSPTKNSPKNSPRPSPRLASKGRKKKEKKNKESLGNSSAHSDNVRDTPKKQKAVRRGSFGAIARRISIGGKSDDDNNPLVEEQQTPSQKNNVRRGSIGGGTEGGNTQGRRASLGSMLGNAVRRASLGGGGHDSSNTQKHKGPAIPEEYHNIIHRERAARGMYLFQRNYILDTIAQGIANDLAAGRAPTPCEFYGNIGKGTSLSVIHSKIMEERKGVSRKNILSQRFKTFGMGLAIGGEKNESIFMCTLFNE